MPLDYPDYQAEAEITVVEMDSSMKTQATKVVVVVMESRIRKAMVWPPLSYSSHESRGGGGCEFTGDGKDMRSSVITHSSL